MECGLYVGADIVRFSVKCDLPSPRSCHKITVYKTSSTFFKPFHRQASSTLQATTRALHRKLQLWHGATDYDNYVVNGMIDQGDATLVLSRGYDAFPGDEFIILSNDAFDVVGGTFSGLAEGSVITLAGIPLR
jgi:hypothetical protein